jgi:type IV fimbrial biogenesis protein FimT
MDDSCALSEAGVSWVVSLDDPSTKCSAEVSETVAPRILDKHASGTAGQVKVDASDALNNDANTVVFNGFGRALDATGMSTIDIDNITSGDDYRALRIVVGTGGTIRMCEPKVTASSDPRKC